MATHAGMSTADFVKICVDWLKTARHPRFNRPYTELVYQPMLELLAYLRNNGFKTFIVSGGGIEFMRPWTEQVYGVPPPRTGGGLEHQNRVQGPERSGGADASACDQFHQRWRWQAGRQLVGNP
jgi:hypothetical protein